MAQDFHPRNLASGMKYVAIVTPQKAVALSSGK
jgi:hypothetical protein